MPASWQRILAGGGVAWALLVAISALQTAWHTPTDPMVRLEREFLALLPELPPAGEVGYLQRYELAGSEDAVRTHYAAQYALVPRIIVARTGPEFVIVAEGTERPGGDARLDGYVEVAHSSAGHRVFRRFPR